MKSLALVLTTILTLCQLSPTSKNEAIFSSPTNYELEPLYLLQPNYVTTSVTEVFKYLTKNEFQQKLTLGFVAKNSRDCNGHASLVPVYRFYNDVVQKYVLSTNQSPPNDTTLAYISDGIAFYASSTQNEHCGLTVPLHSYWVRTHYVYTTDKTSADSVLVQMDGGTYKGIVCHIWLSDELPVTTTTLPTTVKPNCPEKQELPRITILPPMPMTVRSGYTFEIVCNVTGEQPIHVQWHNEDFRQLSNSINVRGNFLEFRNITSKDEGRYHCTAENVHGRVSKVAQVIVQRRRIAG